MSAALVELETRPTVQAYRFELDPNDCQRTQLAKSVGTSRFVYNWGLAESQREYELTGKRPSIKELRKRLVSLKKTECPWLYDVSAHIGQQALEDLGKGLRGFFEGLQGAGPRKGFPRFKRKGERDSARMYEFTLFERHLQMPNIGKVRLKERTTKLKGRLLAVTITREADRWFASVVVERERPFPAPVQGPLVGVDLNVASIVLSDGSVLNTPRPLERGRRKLRRKQRSLSRKEKGSNNRRKAALAVAKQHRRTRNQRKDFTSKLTTRLAKTKSVIVVEGLRMKGMTASARGTVDSPGKNVKQKSGLNRSILDSGWGDIRRQLEYKSGWYGSELLVAPAFYPSTLRCSGCGRVKESGSMPLEERVYVCQTCGLVIDRDLNAALNLKAWGEDQLRQADQAAQLDSLTSGGPSEDACGEDVRPRGCSAGPRAASMKQEAGVGAQLLVRPAGSAGNCREHR